MADIAVQPQPRAKTPKTNPRKSGQIWLALVIANVVLSPVVGLSLGEPYSVIWLCGVVALFTTAFAAAPYARFMDHGWWTRHDEFCNELWGDALSEYLWHFWHRRAKNADALQTLGNGTAANETPEQKAERWENAATVFDQIYQEQYGLGAFAAPLGFLLVFIFLEAHFFGLVSLGSSGSNGGHVLEYVGHLTPANITLSLSAICGAYFFVVGDSVDSMRKECLNSSDVYWYALRMLLAVPIAWALTMTLPDGAAAKVAFALGALPINFIMKQLRRLATGQLKVQEAEEADQLIKLDGVTSPTVALLSTEGITSIDQLLGIDPVLLSIHTGMPFRSVLRLCAQAIVRRHFGDAAFELTALGLADAPSVYSLVQGLHVDSSGDGPDWQVLKDASALLKSVSNKDWPQQEAVRFGFENVASFAYTHFLMAAGFERTTRILARKKQSNGIGYDHEKSEDARKGNAAFGHDQLNSDGQNQAEGKAGPVDAGLAAEGPANERVEIPGAAPLGSPSTAEVKARASAQPMPEIPPPDGAPEPALLGAGGNGVALTEAKRNADPA